MVGWWFCRCCWFCWYGPRASLGTLPVGIDMLRGKSLGMSPRSKQVARLRYSLLAMAEKYTICLVSRAVDGILIRRRAAPMIGRLVPLAECIMRFTGMRSVAVSCRLARRVGPARQLWHPVSAMAVVARLCVSSRKVCPCLRKSSALADV